MMKSKINANYIIINKIIYDNINKQLNHLIKIRIPAIVNAFSSIASLKSRFFISNKVMYLPGYVFGFASSVGGGGNLYIFAG